MADEPSGRSHLLAIEFRRAHHETVSMTRDYVLAHGRLTYGHVRTSRFLLLAALMSLGGCNGAPSRNILGSYFPSWMVCALVGIAVAGIARVILKSTGILQELPAPFVVILAIGCAATFALWLLWLA
jgi:YtcA family